MHPAKKILLACLIALALAGAFFGVAQWRAARVLTAKTEATKRRLSEVAVALAQLEKRVQAETSRAQGAEEDNTRLAAALENARAAAAARRAASASRPTITQESVEARLRGVRELISKKGDPAEILQELLWLYDEGMVAASSYSGVRSSFVLSELKRLGERLPAALDALRERRDRAQKRLLAGADADIPDFVYLNRTLGEETLSMQFYDQLPANDRRRRTMGIYLASLLLEQQRYTEILAGTPFSSISSGFELDTRRVVPAGTANAERIRAADRERIVKRTAEHVEILAGGGQLENARNLARRLLAYDGSEATRAAIQQHAARAGQPELLAEPPVP